jgi:hypothetical protein
MGNASQSEESAFFDEEAIGLTYEEVEKKMQEKMVGHEFFEERLKKMGKSATDLGYKDGLLTRFFSIRDTALYKEPEYEEVISYEKEFGAEAEFESDMTKLPSTIRLDVDKVYYDEQIAKILENSSFRRAIGVATQEAKLVVKLAILEVPNYVDHQPSTVFNTLRLPNELKYFHTALIVGPYKLEWNNTSVILPRKCMLSAIDSFEIGEFVGEELITEKLKVIAETIADYNIYRTYDEISCNSQNFIDELCKKLELKVKFKNYLKRYINILRNEGKAECKYQIPEEILHKMIHENVALATIPNFDPVQSDGEITFATHEQLDEVVNAIISINNDYFYIGHGKDDYKLLKSFDRAFDYRHMRHMIEKKTPHDTFKPLGQNKGYHEVECVFTLEQRGITRKE